ncbi:MAG: ribonuclease HII [Chitinispirillaceae bacterium]|nr:ribonuclease HII [Chitinispirillaceae bacterium]
MKGGGSLAGSDSTAGATVTGKLYSFDRTEAEAGGPLIGIDEAGRGPLAGPVVAAAVLLNLAAPIEGINDSKKCSPKERERLYRSIIASACGWAVGAASSEEIDRLNILQATLTAMFRAVCGLAVAWERALIDGNMIVPRLPACRQKAVVGGDGRSASIAAASIIAKVTRDRMMIDFHRHYPAYRFDRHKGYGTALHRDMIKKYGLCAIHRKSFYSAATVQTTFSL